MARRKNSTTSNLMKIMVPNAVFYGDFSGAIEFSLSRTVQNLCRSKFGKMYQNSYFTAFSTFGANRVQPNQKIDLDEYIKIVYDFIYLGCTFMSLQLWIRLFFAYKGNRNFNITRKLLEIDTCSVQICNQRGRFSKIAKVSCQLEP